MVCENRIHNYIPQYTPSLYTQTTPHLSLFFGHGQLQLNHGVAVMTVSCPMFSTVNITTIAAFSPDSSAFNGSVPNERQDERMKEMKNGAPCGADVRGVVAVVVGVREKEKDGCFIIVDIMVVI